MTIYNFLADIIPHMAVTQGVQSVFDVNMGMPSVMGWYHVGEDVQPAQELTLHERGKGLVLLAVKCNQYAKDRRADMLQGVPASEVAPMFRQRAVQMLGTEDVTYIQDLGALEYGKVCLVAVPSFEAWMGVDGLVEQEHEAEPSVEPAQEPAVEAPDAMESRRNEGFEPDPLKPETLKPETPSASDDDAPEPPTPSATASTHLTAAPSDEPSLFDDSDFDAFIAEDRKRNAPGWVDRMLMQLAIHGQEDRYYRAYSMWSGKMESTYDPSTLMKIYIIGVCVACFIGYFPCTALIDAGCLELTVVFAPLAVIVAAWTGVMLWVNYRVKVLRRTMY